MTRFILSFLFMPLWHVLLAQCPAPVVTASGPTTFCPGGNVTLSTPVAGNTWTQKADLGGAERSYAVGFSIGSKGYIGTGIGRNSYLKDFWEYDTSTNAWTQKADFGGGERDYAVGFSISGKGYIGTGLSGGSTTKDFWEYNPTTNIWTRKADFSGSSRYEAVGFSIGSKGYIGTGYTFGLTKDFWEYDPATNSWIRKADFGGAARARATGLSIGNKGYIGTGTSGSTDYKDFWEYDPATNTWIQKADFSGAARIYATSFSIGSKGYLGTGTGYLTGGRYKDFWEYNPSMNMWTQKADFGGAARSTAIGFSIGSKGYISTGGGSGYYKDFWEFDPGYTYSWSPGGQTTSSITVSTAGNYTITTTNAIGCSATSAATTITTSTAPLITASGSITICPGGNVTLSTPTGSGYTHLWSPGGQTTASINATAAGNYAVTTTNALGCSTTSAITVTTSTPVIPVITASGSTTFCAGGSVTLSTPVLTNNWTQKADFGGTARYGSAGFSIGNKGYMGVGYNGSSYKDFWQYDPATNVWTQKADFGGTARYGTISFAIGAKGYIGTGYDGRSNLKDFWEYDTAANTWTRKADFGGVGRYNAVGFSINNKGYAGTGFGSSYLKDFWEYDPSTDTWTQRPDFGGTARVGAAGFAIGNKGYIGTGVGSGGATKDFWEYNPSANAWIQKADFGGTARYGATGFSIGSRGYMGTGISSGGLTKDFWEYNPATSTWAQKADLGGPVRQYATSFAIGNKGYMGTGNSSSGNGLQDFWEYDPGYTYLWSPGGQTTSSVTVTSIGNYTVTTTNALGCSATSAVTTVSVYNSNNGAIYVDSSVLASGNGTSWATAYKELRDAIKAASFCSDITTINVAKGTYKPTDDANRDSAFVLERNGLAVYGGYPTGGGTRNASANPTILSGDIGTLNNNTDNSYHIMTIVATPATKIDSNTIVDGFIIEKGNANGDDNIFVNSKRLYRFLGGGIYNYGEESTCSPAIRNCRFFNNSSRSNGGAMYNYGLHGSSSPVLTNCVFTNNSSSSNGGAICNDGFLGFSSPVLTNCTFTNNSSSSSGGAIYNYGDWSTISSVLTNCIFTGNSSSSRGGAIYSSCYNGTCSPVFTNCAFINNSSYSGGAIYIESHFGTNNPILTNCTFINNRSNGSGGGIYIESHYGPNNPALTNCTFTSNSSNYNGNAIYNDVFKSTGGPVLTNCILWRNKAGGDAVSTNAAIYTDGSVYSPGFTVAATYSLIQGTDIYAGAGNTNADPLFVDASNAAGTDGIYGTADDGLQLSCSSPAVNTGSNSAVAGIPTDMAGNSRIQRSTIDMGAYESPYDTPLRPSVTVAANPDSTVCEGAGVTFTAAPGNGGATPVYQWKKNGANVGSNSPAYTTTDLVNNDKITVQLTSNASCVYPATVVSDTLFVTIKPSLAKPAITTSGPTAFCAGGSVTLTAPVSASYLWNNGATTQFINVTQSGSYSVSVANSNGCSSPSSDATVVMVNLLPTKPTIIASGSTTFCTGGNVTLTAPVSNSYLWSNGATTQSITVNQSGFYTLSVTNTNGCTSPVSDPITVVVNSLPAKPTITANGPTTFCAGGGVTIMAPASASYLWSNGATTQSVTVNQSGSYSVVVTNSNGCTSPASDATVVTVSILPVKPVITTGGSTTFCAGGSVTLMAPTGFTSYLWSNGATTQSITVNSSGSYSVVVTNGNGCNSPASDAVVVTTNTASIKPVVTAGGPTTFCAGGSVTLTAPVSASYLWSNGATTQSINVTEAGAYNVSVTNSNGCTSPASDATIVMVNTLPAKPTITASGATTFCTGGSVTLTAPVSSSYLWSNGATTQAIHVNQSGSYSVIIKNSNGCSSPSSDATEVTVNTLPAKPTITASGSTTFCVGGSVTLTVPVSGSYLWSNGATSQSITVTQSGSYSVVVTNGNGCKSPASDAIVVTTNAASIKPTITAGGSTTFCSGGGVTLIAPVSSSYLWSNGATTQAITVNQSGSYTVSVTNASGCGSPASDVTVVTVNPLPAKPAITAGGPTTFCAGGSVTLTAPVSGSYLWSNGATTQSITVNQSGSYSVVVTNSNGCSSPASDATIVTVNPLPAKPVITASGPATFNQGGSVTLTAPASAAYLWSTGAVTQSINVTTGGSYTVTVTNSSGCRSVVSDPVIVTVTVPLSVSYLDGDKGKTLDNHIRPYLQLNNEGSTPVAYSSLTVRYWLTVEDFAPMTNLVIDWAQLGTNKVIMKYVKLPQPRAGAFGYIEYSFATNAGNLAAMSNSGPIQSRAGKSDWTDFNEASDYSYAAYNNYTKNNRITLYQNGSLVWGTEPAAITAVQSLKAYSQDKSSGTVTNTLSPWLKVNNEGNTPVSYKDITVRYWFTADGTQPLNYVLDYAQLGSNNITSKFVKLATPLNGADTYLELGFSAADSLYPISTTGNIEQRIAKNDWSQFSQSNDHSYKAGSAMSENLKVTVYMKGLLVYGIEPTAISAMAKSNSTAASKVQPAMVSIIKGVTEAAAKGLNVTVLNNPVTGSEVTLIVRGAQGDRLQVTLLDVQGKIIGTKEMKQAGTTERISLSVSNSAAGTLFVRVSTSKEIKTVQVMRIR